MDDLNEMDKVLGMLSNIEKNQAILYKRVELLGRACEAAFGQVKEVTEHLVSRQRTMNDDLCDMGGCVQNSHW